MSATNRNLYIFILWQNGRVKESEFLKDVSQKFEIFQIYEITWSEEDFAPALARFYGKKLPKGCKKEKETGRGPFLAILFYDNNEVFNEYGNGNVMSAKVTYRNFLGGNLLHGSDSSVETNENTLFLFGKNIDEISKESAFLTPKAYRKNIVGFPCWKDFDEALNIARKCPDTTVNTIKNKILIETKHFDMLKRLLNAEKCWWCNRYKITTAKGSYLINLKKLA